MGFVSKPKATLIVKIMDHGTIVGAEGEGDLEFEDCVNAIEGLVDWMARAMENMGEADYDKIGSEMLIAALHRWTFEEHEDAADEPEEPEEPPEGN
jgi:hypothetical protein